MVIKKFNQSELAQKTHASINSKGNLAVLEGSNISETGVVTPTKIGVHTFDMSLYLHEFLEPIPID